MSLLIGIEIGGTKLQLVAGDKLGTIVERRRLDVDSLRGGAGIRDQIQQALPPLIARTNPVAIGVGFGGPVDWKTGQICCSHQVEGWSEFPLGEWLQTHTGLPVQVENDANTASFAEGVLGAGRGMNPSFYFNMGSGVGGGLVVNGEIYHGAKPGEVEFGHLRLDREGTTVEQRCSGWSVDAKIRAVKLNNPESVLCRMTSERAGGEAKFLAAAVAQGDASAKRIVNETAEDIAFALSHAVHLFHPEVIVMGGGLSLVGEPLRAAVQARLSGFVMEAFHPVPLVKLSGFGEDAVPVGALLLGNRKIQMK